MAAANKRLYGIINPAKINAKTPHSLIVMANA